MTTDQNNLTRLVQVFGSRVATKAEAEQNGYAGFNGYPHLCVDLPSQGGLTITCKTAEGKRITFSFVPYEDGTAGCCDIQYHDSPAPKVMNGKTACPVMHSIGFTPGTNTFDTRKQAKPTTLITVLLADKHYVS